MVTMTGGAVGIGVGTSCAIMACAAWNASVSPVAVARAFGVSAVVGLAADSAKAFAAQNIYSDFLVAAVCLGSIAIGKPLVGAVARESIPALRTLMDPRHRVFVILTLVFMTYNIGTGIFRIFLLGEFSANEYVIVSRVTSPISLAFFLAAYFMIKRAAGLSQQKPAT